MIRRIAFFAFFLISSLVSQAQSLRERQLWDDRWRFNLGDTPEAKEATFNDSAWRQLHLPHDWSIEGQTDPNAPTAGGGGFFPTGIGWYRRSFVAPTIWIGKRVQLEFEGVAGHAEIWLNGKPVATHPNSFTSFFADLTPHLKHGRDNFLAIRVDNSKQPNTRYYTGSGLYATFGSTSPVPSTKFRGAFSRRRQNSPRTGRLSPSRPTSKTPATPPPPFPSKLRFSAPTTA